MINQLNLVPASFRFRPYQSYKDSGVEWLGEIPEHWEVKRLKNVTQINPEVLPEAADPDYALQYIDITNVNEKGSIIDVQELRFEDAPSRARRMVRHGDTIISTVRTYLKAIGFIDDPPENLIVSTGFAVLRAMAAVKPAFLWRLVQSQQFVDSVVSHSEGVSYPAINPSRLACLPILLPPTAEQAAITGFIDQEAAKIDALVEKKERQIELLQEKRTALISQTVTRGLDPNVPLKDSGVEWLGHIPSHWEVKRLKFIIEFVTSGSRGWAQYYSDEGAIFLRIGNLSRFSLKLNLNDVQFVEPPAGAEVARTRVKNGDVLISITAYIGSVSIIEEAIGEAYVNQHIALTRPLTGQVEPRWLGYVLLSEIGQHQFRVQLYGGTKEGFGLDDVKNLFILLPPLCEQKSIVSSLNQATGRIDTLITRIQESIDRLKEYRTALISAAVTGKIDVREAGNT